MTKRNTAWVGREGRFEVFGLVDGCMRIASTATTPVQQLSDEINSPFVRTGRDPAPTCCGLLTVDLALVKAYLPPCAHTHMASPREFFMYLIIRTPDDG